jgi:excisionase family DNA binding protein
MLEQLKRSPIPKEAASKPIEDIGAMSVAETITGLAKPTIYALVAKRKIPCMKKGKRLYFSRAELTDWIKKGRLKSTAEKEEELVNILREAKGHKRVKSI